MAMTPTRGRWSTGTATSSMAFDDDAMEEASVFTVTSPPRSASKSSAASKLFHEESTPKSSRRLFGGGGDDDEDEEQGFQYKRAPALTPYNGNPRRRAAHPPIHRQDSTESADMSGRKRSSIERRDSHESSGDVSMHMSPYISPNSYVTLDGRFVTSKNPFSSPMITEDDNHHHHIQMTANAPSMPLIYSASSHASFSMDLGQSSAGAATPASPDRSAPTLGVLPPRQLREKRGPNRDRVYGIGSGGNGNATSFVDSRFSFTGSPIPEHSLSTTTHNPGSGMASGGSFQKVRRLTEHDDVVSASGHQLYYNRRRPHLSIETSTIDLSCTSLSDSSTGDWKTEDEDSDRISPTDIFSFPPPPTPAKPGSNNYPRYRAPPTPVAQRRHERLQQRRTPHPGSILRRHHPEDPDEDTQAVKSRFHDDFDIIQELGKGSFGTVYQVLSRLDGCMYAIKAAQRPAKGASDRDRMMKEVYALATLSDQADTATFHIVRYHQAWMEEDRLFIQTELCQGNLVKEMTQNRLNLARRYKLLREMCLALAFLHRHEMVHLDIKPENIFIKNDQFKLGDFGLVSKSTSHEDVEEGDSRYMSLELLSGDHSDLTKSDIFSLGATLYEICRGQALPINGEEWQEMRQGRLQHIHQDGVSVDAGLVHFIHQMMHSDASHRPSAADLLQHPMLLSDEQKALRAERHKVEQAREALQRLSPRPPPPTRPRPFGRTLQRASTWSGNSCHF